MILPIYAYGFSVLKKIAEDIDKDYPELEKLISNMWDTMYNAQGIGLAAPQVGLSIRLFLVDTKQSMEEEEKDKGIKKVFINAEIIEEAGDDFSYEEGCLSIPGIKGDVFRPEQVKIKYLDEQFKEHIEVYEGINARVIQHEYDHIDGILFTELLGPIKRRRIKKKLDDIKIGKLRGEYKMKYLK
ncbi:MAG: peptide deformylase [Saprospiraceae bacterium]|nr:peptide deformylase [Saprospiraceae bacterium]